MKNWSWTLCTLLAFGLAVHLEVYGDYQGHSSPPKPGDCPDFISTLTADRCDDCFVDSNCNGNEKCCRTGCGRQCVEPTFNNTLDKPGVCPYFKLGRYWGTCDHKDECSNDQNCNGDEKCCRKGCRRVCVAPFKHGLCPRLTRRWRWRNCTDECSNDFHCAGSEKCCRKGCKRVCVPSVKPGTCPRLALCTRPTKCSNDFDCPGYKKCCHQPCGNVCVTPEDSCRSYWCLRRG